MVCRLVHAPSQPTYDLGASHPFAPHRQRPLFDLIESMGLLTADERLAPPELTAASQEELELAHAADYVDAIRALSADHPGQETLAHGVVDYGMGTSDNPIVPGQHRGAAAVVGATLACVREVMAGRAARACNTTGGLHHAQWSRASGFCIYNDLVAGIREARRLGAPRVLYVDFDVHHGDGVEMAFAEDPDVLTVSFHESPDTLWPGTGRITDQGRGEGLGYAVNVPLLAGTGDRSWCATVDAVLPAVTRAFGPDLIVSQHGCDAHREDPLANLDCTIAAFVHAARTTAALADEVCGGRWVATGGGGYQPYRVIPRAWGAVWCVLSGRQVPSHVDANWRARWSEQSGQNMPETWLDEEGEDAGSDRTLGANAATVQQLLDRIGWL